MSTQVLAEAEKRGHEQVAYFNYPKVGLKAIVGIHNTALGPALGGCRMRLYESEAQALEDAMRLSEGMTYKSAIAGLALGGGKCCIIADPNMKEGRRELFLQFAECLNHLSGRYITAEDMGTSVSDIMIVREKSKHVAGIDPKEGGGGDPSPWTALGTYWSILAACERKYGDKSLQNKTIAVQGVGHVGMYLVELLHKDGAKLVVTDTCEASLNRAKQEYGATVVGLDEIYGVECDVYSPCAIGQTVNPKSLKELKCDIIAGAANNQLVDSSVYETILEKNILYCPDFVINAGGVINVGAEYVEGGWKESWVKAKTDNIYHTTHKVLEEAAKTGDFTEVVAIRMAKEIVKAAEERKAG